MENNIITTTPDFSLLESIHKQCFPNYWRTMEFADMFMIKGAWAVICDNMGLGILRIIGDEAEIITIATLPEYRQQGIGKKIVQSMLGLAKKQNVKEIFLEVRESNIAAQKLYLSAGFAIISKRKNYYHNEDGTCEDALIMKMDLLEVEV